MLSFLKGVLVEKAIDSPRGAYFLMDVHGVGFEVLSSQHSVQTSAPSGETVQLFTSMIVREDSMSLVGFSSREERDLFNILQSASGVGVKVSLALLSSLSVSDIAQAVVSNNHGILTKAKGVGPKLAQKITLDLKEKMINWRSSEMITRIVMDTTQTPHTEALTEAETVLLSLGYQPDEIARSFKALANPIDETVTSEEVLRESLRWLAHSV